jgi:hypothetical protein
VPPPPAPSQVDDHEADALTSIRDRSPPPLTKQHTPQSQGGKHDGEGTVSPSVLAQASTLPPPHANPVIERFQDDDDEENEGWDEEPPAPPARPTRPPPETARQVHTEEQKLETTSGDFERTFASQTVDQDATSKHDDDDIGEEAQLHSLSPHESHVPALPLALPAAEGSFGDEGVSDFPPPLPSGRRLPASTFSVQDAENKPAEGSSRSPPPPPANVRPTPSIPLAGGGDFTAEQSSSSPATEQLGRDDESEEPAPPPLPAGRHQAPFVTLHDKEHEVIPPAPPSGRRSTAASSTARSAESEIGGGSGPQLSISPNYPEREIIDDDEGGKKYASISLFGSLKRSRSHRSKILQSPALVIYPFSRLSE